MVREWREPGVAVDVNVIGFGVDAESRDALQCISSKAGTNYRNADSATELADQLARIQMEAAAPRICLVPKDTQGNLVPAQGHLGRAGADPIPIPANGRATSRTG